MANTYLSDTSVVNNQLRTSAAVDKALSTFEKNLFGSTQAKAHEQSNEASTDSLSYLFSIFAY